MSGSRSLLRPSRRSRQGSPRPASAGEVEVRLCLLGAFELASDRAPARLPLSAQRVVAFVALHERPLPRAHVAGSLWLDSPEDRAGANLRSALWRIQRVEPRLIEVSDRQLQLREEVQVDLREAEAVARRELAGDGAGGAGVEISVLAGDLLPDWYEDWVLFERERFRQVRLRALDALCDRLTRAGRLNEAMEAALLSVAGDPLRESAHRALVRVHLSEGNAGEAVRAYRLYRRLLDEQLGIQPSERMQELVAGLDNQETEW
jgi:DNA-binding SARP family transcriptional activator